MFDFHLTKNTWFIVGFVLCFLFTIWLNWYGWRKINGSTRPTRKYVFLIFLMSLFGPIGILFTLTIVFDSDDFNIVFPGWNRFWEGKV